MRCLFLLLLFLAAPAQAQTVSVKSGEHGAFTRLVLTFPAPVDWVLGRTSGGYGLQVTGPFVPYDLSSIYELITKDRLRSVWVDPANGNLLLGVDCPCHAIPFEFETNILVIDIKDGPPPEMSSFELSLSDGAVLPAIQSTPPQRPRRNAHRVGNYNWLVEPSHVQGSGSVPPKPEAVTAALEADLRLEDFRSMLIDEVGRGATQGVVEMEQPPPRRDTGSAPQVDSGPENARAAIDALPGIEVSTEATAMPDLMVQGETCPKAVDLDIGGWSESDDAATELARARAALLAEFDEPDPDRLTQAVNTHLYFGFGAEARLLLASFLPVGQSDPLRAGLSYLVDGATPPENPFQNMQSCDSAAALWALLTPPPKDALPFVNGNAVSRTFLSLPAQLRASLGPETVKRLLASGDSANAEIVWRSFERAASRDDASVGLLAADQALRSGDAAGAEAALPVDATGEVAVAALVALVEARFQQRKALGGKDILALESFAFEHGDGPLRPALDRALALANALGDDFAAAFSDAEGTPSLEQDVWMLLAETGPVSQLLTFAGDIDPTRRIGLPLVTQNKMAERLLAAGMPNIAAIWAQSNNTDNDLAARIALANGDARAALRLLAPQSPKVEHDLLAASYIALGDFSAAASAYQTAGKPAEAARLNRWGGTWPSAAEMSEESSGDPWSMLAGLLAADDTAALQPLQASQARLERSSATREAIANLLETAPVEGVP